nr:MAG TPA: hypothetical protein [Caudoviricetes sp.]DAU41804.1 MAG TPA: hypothetical protein [Caudoviricetes sp.]
MWNEVSSMCDFITILQIIQVLCVIYLGFALYHINKNQK